MASKWQPETNEMFYFLGDGEVKEEMWVGMETDRWLARHFTLYKTREDAERVLLEKASMKLAASGRTIR